MNRKISMMIADAAIDPFYCIVKETSKKRVFERPDTAKIAKYYGISESLVRNTINDWGLKYPITYMKKGSDWYLADKK